MTPPRPDPVGETLRLREYLRVSKDPNGLETSPNEQHEDHVRDAERHGFTLHPEAYRDIGSASRSARKARLDFDRMMADLKAGGLDADGIAVWEPSRGSRQVWEWALLIDLLAEQHLQVWVSSHGKFYDPRRPRDRRNLQEDAVDAEYESGKTSDRMIRSHASRARQGKPVGRLTYGYRSVYDAKTGKLQGRDVVPEQAEHVEKLLFDLFVKTQSVGVCTKAWAKAGLLNGAGKPFGSPQLREMLRNRVYIAERVHIAGQITRWWRVSPSEVAITPGTWEPIVSRKVFFDAQEILDDETRSTTRPGGARHLLTMIARCDTCGGPLCAGVRRSGRIMKCRDTGCVLVRQDDLDKFGEKLILAWLSNPKVYTRAQSVGAAAAEELKAAKAATAECRKHHRDLVASVKAKRMSLVAFEALEPGALEDLEKAQTKERALEMPSDLQGLIEPGPNVAVRWAAIEDVRVRRRIAQAVLIPSRAGQLRIKPTPSPGFRTEIQDRVRVLRDSEEGKKRL